MSQAKPPLLATWILDHLPSNEALSGDLLEQFRSGRSSLWYWRQVLAATATELRAELLPRWRAIAFALVWSTFGWPIFFSYFFTYFPRNAHWLWYIEWPYSILLISIGLTLLSLWSGILGYLCLHAAVLRSGFQTRAIARSLWLSPFVLALLMFPLRALLGPMKLSLTTYVALSDAAYFISLLAALWSLAPFSPAPRRHSAT